MMVVVLFGCNSEKLDKVLTENNMDSVSFNTINKKPLSNKNPELFTKYYQRFGIMIQQYYQITDSLPIDLDLDGSIDTLVVLTPKSLENADYFDKMNDSLPKRLLIEVMNMKGISKVGGIHQNLISDAGGVLSKYIGIEKTNNGFELKHEAGNKYTWIYNVEFSVRKNESIALKKIHKECGYDDEVITQEMEYDNYSLEKFNLLDSMKINCNCDESWKLLTDKYK